MAWIHGSKTVETARPSQARGMERYISHGEAYLSIPPGQPREIVIITISDEKKTH